MTRDVIMRLIAYPGFAIMAAGLCWMVRAFVFVFSKTKEVREKGYDHAGYAYAVCAVGYIVVAASGIPVFCCR